jgi:hypothetical protein
MKAHTMTTQARVGGRGRMKRRIVPGGILALSLAVVLLAATASTASAERVLGTWNCPPPSTPPTTLEQIPEGCFSVPSAATPSDQRSFDFGYDRIGTSTSQRFALGVSGEAFNPRIGVSGDYAQTNNCPPTLSAGADPQIDGCLITVTFAPTGEGARRGILRTGPGGPEVALEGGGYLGRSFHDPRGDAVCERGREGYGEKPCLASAMRSAETVRATAGHEGGRLRHTIRVVGRFQSGSLGINTDSDPDCEWGLDLKRGKRKVEFRNLRECRRHAPSPGPGGRARVEFHRHSVEVLFRESQIGNPPGYGWQAGTSALGPPDRGLAYDYVPNGFGSYPGEFGSYIRHELG